MLPKEDVHHFSSSQAEKSPQQPAWPEISSAMLWSLLLPGTSRAKHSTPGEGFACRQPSVQPSWHPPHKQHPLTNKQTFKVSLADLICKVTAFHDLPLSCLTLGEESLSACFKHIIHHEKPLFYPILCPFTASQSCTYEFSRLCLSLFILVHKDIVVFLFPPQGLLKPSKLCQSFHTEVEFCDFGAGSAFVQKSYLERQ